MGGGATVAEAVGPNVGRIVDGKAGPGITPVAMVPLEAVTLAPALPPAAPPPAVPLDTPHDVKSALGCGPKVAPGAGGLASTKPAKKVPEAEAVPEKAPEAETVPEKPPEGAKMTIPPRLPLAPTASPLAELPDI
jgi:hypothetical protein